MIILNILRYWQNSSRKENDMYYSSIVYYTGTRIIANISESNLFAQLELILSVSLEEVSESELHTKLLVFVLATSLSRSGLCEYSINQSMNRGL